MANFVSPGVYVIEKDVSQYLPSLTSTTMGIVGFADRGPTNVATLITSQQRLEDVFGKPSEAIPGQGLEGALEILEQTNALYFVRAASDSAAEASTDLQIGSPPGFIVSGCASGDEDTVNGFGVSRPLTLRIQVYNNDGTAQFTENDGAGKDFTVPILTESTAGFQSRALRSKLGGSLDSDKVYVDTTLAPLSGIVLSNFAGSGAYMDVSAFSGTTATADKAAPILRLLHPSATANSTFGVSGDMVSSLRCYGSTLESQNSDINDVKYFVESLYPGAGYNGGLKSDGTYSGISISVESRSGPKTNFIVLNEGAAAETFSVGITGSGIFVEEVINTGTTNLKSNYIKGNIYYQGVDDTGVGANFLYSDHLGTIFNANVKRFIPVSFYGTPGFASNGIRFAKFVETGLSQLTGGDSGTPIATTSQNTALIGDATAAPKTGLYALDDPLLNISVALIPGFNNQTVQNALITVAETSQNFLALIAPPYGIGGVQNAIDWTNGLDTTRTAAVNSSYAAVYWPWVKVFSTFDGKDRWYDPTIFAARQIAFNDSVGEVWTAPAGFVRGRLTKPTDVEVKLNQGDRDSMYSGGNVVNPIVGFPQQGITIFGQRTTQRQASALDRINVRRMLIYIKKIILGGTQSLVFEPNDQQTWTQVENLINPLLNDIQNRRGITEYSVVCDETTNTPLRVDRNEMWCKVVIRPTKTAEIVVFELNITNQTANLGEV